MEKKVLNASLSTLYGISFTLMIFTFPIFFILVFRPFFYSQINFLHTLDYLARYGYNFTYLDVKSSYDALLDSLLFNYPFSEGVFFYSESGMNHFLDCIPLFLLVNITLIVSFVIFVTLFILEKKKVFVNLNFKGFSSLSLTPLVLILLLLIVVIVAAINFDFAFRIFHSIFFPGKENWIFYYDEDPIILIFPEAFFINCMIFIIVVFLILAFIPLISEIVKKYKEKQKSKYLLDNINS